MSYRLFDLNNIFELIELTAEITYNGELIGYCFHGIPLEPKDYVDDDYWFEYVEYIYRLFTQRYFNYPDLVVAADSKTLLNVQLARVKFDFLPTEGHDDEYKKIYAMTQAACLPIIKLQSISGGLVAFDVFKCDYENHKITFYVNSEEFTTDLSASEVHTFRFIEETLGCTMALDNTNIAFINTMQNPFKDIKVDANEEYFEAEDIDKILEDIQKESAAKKKSSGGRAKKNKKNKNKK